jgi:hypothetical protein
MSMKDAEMHVVSLFGAGVLAAALSVPLVWLTGGNRVDGPVLKEQEVIEATIAYRKTPQKQPQKKTAPPPVEEPEGVSRDENKKVEEKPKKEEKKPDPKPDPNNPIGKFDRSAQQAGPTTQPTVGDFNGSEKGFAEESKGDPFFGRLRGDMNFTFPEISKATSIPVGCIHLQADGRIKAVTFDPPIGQKGDDDLQTAAEAALNELKKTRAQTPEPVPTHLLSITSKWLCFKFSVSSG